MPSFRMRQKFLSRSAASSLATDAGRGMETGTRGSSELQSGAFARRMQPPSAVENTSATFRVMTRIIMKRYFAFRENESLSFNAVISSSVRKAVKPKPRRKQTCSGLAFLGVGRSVEAENVGGEALADGQNCPFGCSIATGIRRWKKRTRLVRDAVGCSRKSRTRLQRFHLKISPSWEKPSTSSTLLASIS